LSKVTYADDHKLLGYYNITDQLGGFSVSPLIEDDATSRKLRGIGLDRTDAHHLMLAVASGCTVFLTCDVRSILKHRGKIEAQYPIKVLRPSEYRALLGV